MDREERIRLLEEIARDSNNSAARIAAIKELRNEEETGDPDDFGKLDGEGESAEQK